MHTPGEEEQNEPKVDPNLTKAQQTIQAMLFKHQRENRPTVIKQIFSAKAANRIGKNSAAGSSRVAHGIMPPLSSLLQAYPSRADPISPPLNQALPGMDTNIGSAQFNAPYGNMGGATGAGNSSSCSEDISASSVQSILNGLSGDNSVDGEEVPGISAPNTFNKYTGNVPASFNGSSDQPPADKYIENDSRIGRVLEKAGKAIARREQKEQAVKQSLGLDLATNPAAALNAPRSRGRPNGTSKDQQAKKIQQRYKRETEAYARAHVKVDQLDQAKIDSDRQLEVAAIAQEEAARAQKTAQTAEDMLAERERQSRLSVSLAIVLGTAERFTLKSICKDAQKLKGEKERAAAKYIKIACAAQAKYKICSMVTAEEAEVNPILEHVIKIRSGTASSDKSLSDSNDTAQSLMSLSEGGNDMGSIGDSSESSDKTQESPVVLPRDRNKNMNIGMNMPPPIPDGMDMDDAIDDQESVETR